MRVGSAPGHNVPYRDEKRPIIPTTDIEPVDRESTAALIACQLRDAITTGSLPPSTQLGEADLATRFRVSRGPLCEAMQRLVSEGPLRGERHRGLFVIDLGPEDVRDIYTSRAAVEHAALHTILDGGHESAADRLATSVAAMADAATMGDAAALTEADLRFREALIAASDSPRLNRMASALMIETRMCLAMLTDTYESAGERVTEHHEIATATYLVSRYSSTPREPPSRPRPDSLIPPNGAAAFDTTPLLRPTIPASSFSDTRRPRFRLFV